MLWRRRNEGFEWKEYVRTTVLLRRRQRRDRIDAASHAAAEGLKDAGRKGLALGAAGAEAAGRGAASAAATAAKAVADSAGKAARSLGTLLGTSRQAMATATAPLSARLLRPLLSNTLAAVAILATIGFVVRWRRFGADSDALLIGSVAILAALLWAWPRLFAESARPLPRQGPAGTDDPEPTRLTTRLLTGRVPLASLLPLALAGAFAALMLWFAAPVVQGWFVSSGPTSDTRSRPAGDLVGDARLDALGQLRVAGTIVRLDAVTILDPAQTCRRADGSSWSCGEAAHSAFQKLIRGRHEVACTFAASGGGPPLATCEAGGRDLAAELVHGGHAFADGTLWTIYSNEESEARAAAAGLWAGEPERPPEWRSRMWDEAEAAAPGGCPIKGRVSGNRKTYILPGDSDYDRTALRPSRGDRWFCSEAEAAEAGFSPRDRG